MSNDSKYGRLYPDCAVAPLRDIARRLLEPNAPAGPEADDALEEALEQLDDFSFPADEPIFALRGQDELAPDTVRFYADLVEARGADLDVEDLNEFADRMRAWTPRKLPD